MTIKNNMENQWDHLKKILKEVRLQSNDKNEMKFADKIIKLMDSIEPIYKNK